MIYTLSGRRYPPVLGRYTVMTILYEVVYGQTILFSSIYLWTVKLLI